ncbi:MAG: EamA family transporter [Terriglobales bacterium]
MAYTWIAITVLVVLSTAGDVLISHAMKKIGDLQELFSRRGLFHVIGRVVTSGTFLLGIAFMAMAFFSLLLALSWADVSLVGPASASLTFITNAVAARIFLKERVDSRRWAAAVFVAAGVALLAG